jgi:phage terminase small subunit
MSKDQLTPKQERFCEEYLIDLNATQAAFRAGYSAKTANEQGARLLANVSVASKIDELKKARAEVTGITAERVLKEIAKLAFFDPRKLLNGDGTPKAIHELDDETAAAVAGIDIVTKGNDDLGYADVMKIKLADKGQNLERLGRHLKLFTERIEVSDSSELATRIKEARERGAK